MIYSKSDDAKVLGSILREAVRINFDTPGSRLDLSPIQSRAGYSEEIMNLSAVQEIERAIDALTREQLEELYLWLDQHHPQAIDACIQSDLAAGRLDNAVQRALDDEQKNRLQPL